MTDERKAFFRSMLKDGAREPTDDEYDVLEEFWGQFTDAWDGMIAQRAADEMPHRPRRNEWADAMALYAHWHAKALASGDVERVRANRARHWASYVAACDGYTKQQTERALERRFPEDQ